MDHLTNLLWAGGTRVGAGRKEKAQVGSKGESMGLKGVLCSLHFHFITLHLLCL